MLKNGQFKISLRTTIQRSLMRGILGSLMRIMFKIEFEGFENIPKSGPYIIAYNHTSLIEPPLLLAYWPTHPEALSGHDVWDRPGQGLIVKLYRATPVKRGQFDRQVFKTMTAQLEAGRPIAIAPEGGQSSAAKMRQAHAGIAYMIEKMKVPVIPVAIAGSYKGILKDAIRGKRPQLKYQVGKMFNLPPVNGNGQAKRDLRQKNADEVMIRIARMMPEKYHGYYAGKLDAN